MQTVAQARAEESRKYSVDYRIPKYPESPTHDYRQPTGIDDVGKDTHKEADVREYGPTRCPGH